MINLKQSRAYHKIQLYRLLSKLIDDNDISSNIFFKGGTCSSMLGFLDRFSVDLDFDLKIGADKKVIRKKLYSIFKKLNLTIKDESKEALQFFLKYEAPPGQRNTIKLDIIDNLFESIDYSPQYFKDIDRTIICQTIESIFANKLVALTDRFKKRNTIAGRDVYDIHYFFSHGYNYNKQVIEERTKEKTVDYLKTLKNFIEDKITQKIINQDLNILLSDKKFQVIRKTLKAEVLILIKDEIKSILS